jgi:tetratricopeptide (TPR) repeat protein
MALGVVAALVVSTFSVVPASVEARSRKRPKRTTTASPPAEPATPVVEVPPELASPASPPAAPPASSTSATRPGPSSPSTHSGGGRGSAPRPLRFSPARAAAGDGGAAFQQGIKLYEQKNFYAASIEFGRVASGEARAGEEDVRGAEFWLGKALYELRFYSAALSQFDQIIEKGRAHPYHNATLKWLAALTKRLPEASIRERVSKFQREDFEQPELRDVRDQLLFLLARHNYEQGMFKETIEVLGAILDNSPMYLKARFLEGITHIRTNDPKAGAESFKQILRVTAGRTEQQPALAEFDDLANLSLARVFYSVGQFKTSVKYFDKVPQESVEWPNSLFESAWSYFMMDQHSKTLGNIHSLNAPFFENEFFPESYILKAVVYFRRCLYDRSAEAIADFNGIYVPIKADLDRLVQRTQNPVDFYALSKRILAGNASLPDRSARMARRALVDRQVRKRFEYVEELERELRQLDRADPSWKGSAIGARVLEDLSVQKSLAENEAGTLARQRLTRMVEETQELVQQAIKVEYETLNAQKGQLESQLRNEQVIPENVQSDKEVTVDDEHEYWPFQGEYWKDELGAYRFRVPSKCSR